ncbi:isoprenylcysteine carboxylmethyltransferase family protein, partial [Rhizobiaceae bacterium]|nr:isoprenylcysteine carboxylmethyltransferase family protein [Rhizobiaceae bacterium]
VMGYVGIAVISLAIALDVWAALTFRRHAANIMPHRAASTLIESGPFALSRNPIYLANVMLTLGVGLALDSRWFLLGAAALILVLQRFAIMREEAHMATLFGQAWQEYTLRVRRWI